MSDAFHPQLASQSCTFYRPRWSFSLYQQPALHFAHKFWVNFVSFPEKHRLFS